MVLVAYMAALLVERFGVLPVVVHLDIDSARIVVLLLLMLLADELRSVIVIV